MAFRFRKSVKIAPGIRLNFSKSGVSTSIGKRGATVNLSKRGTRVTVGLPGTGLSTSKLYKAAPQSQSQRYTESSKNTSKAIGWILLLIIGGIAIKACGDDAKPRTDINSRTNATGASASAQPSSQAYTSAMAPADTATSEALQVQTRYVGPKSLNVRSSPNGAVSGSLKHGAAVEIHAEEGGWARISADGQPARWLSSTYLCTQQDCSDVPKWKPQPAAPPASARMRQAAPPVSNSYGCSCASSNDCYGPRGGRYCITSGGNKRYR